MQILLATNNSHKIDEIKEIMGDLRHHLKSLDDFPQFEAPLEDGATYEENALKKALHYHRLTGLPTLADDSGLEIEAFGGQPGIFSARFIDPAMSFAERNRIVLERMKDTPPEKRGARFVCCCVLVMSEKKYFAETGILPGQIGGEITGEYGFGYEPVFLLPEKGVHLAQVTPGEKNRISHRAKAFMKMKIRIDELLSDRFTEGIATK